MKWLQNDQVIEWMFRLELRNLHRILKSLVENGARQKMWKKRSEKTHHQKSIQRLLQGTESGRRKKSRKKIYNKCGRVIFSVKMFAIIEFIVCESRVDWSSIYSIFLLWVRIPRGHGCLCSSLCCPTAGRARPHYNVELS